MMMMMMMNANDVDGGGGSSGNGGALFSCWLCARVLFKAIDTHTCTSVGAADSSKHCHETDLQHPTLRS